MDNDKNILLVDCIFILLWIESKAKLFFWKQLSKTLTYLTFLLMLLSKKHKNSRFDSQFILYRKKIMSDEESLILKVNIRT